MDVLTMLVGLSALVLAGLTIRDRFAYEAGNEPQVVSDWHRFAEGPTYGKRGSTVTLIQFSDFQCPACRNLNLTLQALLEESEPDVLVYYRHYPITRIHPYARDAAVAAECAHLQGRFEAYHDILYERQDSISSDRLLHWAETAGIPDRRAFEDCVAGSSAVLARLRSDSVAATELQVRSTPTLLINGRVVVGAPSPESLRALVDSARSNIQ